MMIEIDDYAPPSNKGRKINSKNRVAPERERLLNDARNLVAIGYKKINAAYRLNVESKLNIKAETFAKLI
ncbi:hypothetical protein [uncultured Sphingomonas sp.]|uniref:hypothetical protein n=1 Tax=uncultured Sphingomonas sp. TaxID=158754 RepID=UPI0025EFA3EB|nr:hypothetical protein [uncultured Sphingomonas sp.]